MLLLRVGRLLTTLLPAGKSLSRSWCRLAGRLVNVSELQAPPALASRILMTSIDILHSLPYTCSSDTVTPWFTYRYERVNVNINVLPLCFMLRLHTSSVGRYTFIEYTRQQQYSTKSNTAIKNTMQTNNDYDKVKQES